MLFRLLALRGPTESKTHAFRWRGDGVSRIEGLSDAVFGFAITLVAVSLEVPRTADTLLHNAAGFVPFVLSFLVLFFVWRAQFEFFRRYGLEDAATLNYTGLLLISVLFLIYPLKFLFTVFGDSFVTGTVAKDRMRLEQFPAVIALYGGGFTGIATAFMLLYRHALGLRESLALTELEAFDTVAMYRRWTRAAIVGVGVVLWCASMMAMPEHMRARDAVFRVVMQGGSLLLVTLSLTQVYLRRRIQRERAALITRLGADVAPPPVVLLD